MVLSQFLAINVGTHVFHIDSNMPIIREGIESEIPRMRKIEMQTGTMRRRGYKRFSIAIRHETDLTWINVQIMAQQSPQNSMCNDPMKMVFFKIKLPGPFEFLMRKNALEFIDCTERGFQRSPPDVDLVFRQDYIIWRSVPEMISVTHKYLFDYSTSRRSILLAPSQTITLCHHLAALFTIVSYPTDVGRASKVRVTTGPL